MSHTKNIIKNKTTLIVISSVLGSFILIGVLILAISIYISTHSVNISVLNDTSSPVTIMDCGFNTLRIEPAHTVSIDVKANEASYSCRVFSDADNGYLGCLSTPTTPSYINHTFIISGKRSEVLESQCGQ